jgi:hypothetical protein
MVTGRNIIDTIANAYLLAVKETEKVKKYQELGK